jgi:DNA-binding NarL/FixJ family response regulator
MTETSLQGIRVFLLDDHPAVREGLSILLSRHGIVICGEAGNLPEARRVLATACSDLVLVDLSLGNENGIDLIRDLHSAGMKTLVYSMHDDARHIRTALVAGAQGYVTKREMTGALIDAIGSILAGRDYISPVAAEALDSDAPAEEERLVSEHLSAREQEIFLRVGEGYPTADIADELQLSISTVETNIARIIAKLKFSGTKEMRRYAIQHLRNTRREP